MPQVPGHAIVARASGAALVIWDATVEITDIVKNRTSDADAKTRLERDALGVLAAEQSKLSGATSIVVRIIYTKTGDVSPVYGSATFAGVERYATLTMSSADAQRDRDRWKEGVAKGDPIPAWPAFSISGELPQR